MNHPSATCLVEHDDPGPRGDKRDSALADLLSWLQQSGYSFVTVTPITHARVVARSSRHIARSLFDVFGWSLPFEPGLLPPAVFRALEAADMLDQSGTCPRSRVRVSTVRNRLFLHSAYPTLSADAVFLGPDSYRFADLIASELTNTCPPGARIIDVGTGAGVGALTAASCCPAAAFTMSDINPQALRLARVNAAAAGVAVNTIVSPGFDRVPGTFDVVLMNPPFIVDRGGPAYRDGGDMHGGQLSLDLAQAALGRLNAGGRLILYTGSAIVAGDDRLHTALAQAAAAQRCSLAYREIDPDVFGEELSRPAYSDVDRIAAVAATFTREPADAANRA